MPRREFKGNASWERVAAYLEAGPDPDEAERVPSLRARLGAPLPPPRVARAVEACRMGASPDVVAGHMDWQEFEGFCAALLEAAGYAVTKNIVLTKPRAQVDILARGNGVALVVDCKRWTAGQGASTLIRAVDAQKKRVDRLRALYPDAPPMAVVILALRDEQFRYADGAAVVPVHALADFARNVEAYSELLEFH